MLLKEIAHSRTGDKGNISVISVIAYQQEDYKLIKEKVTVEKLKDYFKDIVHGKFCYGRCLRWWSNKIISY